jgi:hypothetical protein
MESPIVKILAWSIALVITFALSIYCLYSQNYINFAINVVLIISDIFWLHRGIKEYQEPKEYV